MYSNAEYIGCHFSLKRRKKACCVLWHCECQFIQVLCILSMILLNAGNTPIMDCCTQERNTSPTPVPSTVIKCYRFQR